MKTTLFSNCSPVRLLAILLSVTCLCWFIDSPVHGDVFDDLIDIVIDDLDEGVNLVSEFGIAPSPFELELEHMGAGGFDVDIVPLAGCDFMIRIAHFAPLDGIDIGALDWQVADIHMRQPDGEALFHKIVDVEEPVFLNDMPTDELFFTDWVVSMRIGEFSSVATGAFNDYIVRVAVIGDVNRDCEINLLDVGPFVDILSEGGYSVEADINQDGALNLLDVSEFVSLLSE